MSNKALIEQLESELKLFILNLSGDYEGFHKGFKTAIEVVEDFEEHTPEPLSKSALIEAINKGYVNNSYSAPRMYLFVIKTIESFPDTETKEAKPVNSEIEHVFDKCIQKIRYYVKHNDYEYEFFNKFSNFEENWRVA